jgi:hypothetical protein
LRLLAAVFSGSMTPSASAAEPQTWVDTYRAAVSDQRPPDGELWISEFDDANWRYVTTYQRWAKSFNDASTWHKLATTPSREKVSGSVIATELDAAGGVVGAELLRTSGSAELDTFALEVARAVTRGVAIPKALVEQGKKIKVVAMIGFIVPEGGGQARPRASVNDVAFHRFSRKMSEIAAAGFAQLKHPAKGDVTLQVAFRQGRVVNVDADPAEGTQVLREFAVREFKKIAESLPNSPALEAIVVLPLVIR